MPDQRKSATATADSVLMTVTLDQSKASIAAAAKSLGVPVESIDAEFGLVPIDPDRGLYSVKIPSAAVPGGTSGTEFRGPFSNPRIAPFGLSKRKAR